MNIVFFKTLHKCLAFCCWESFFTANSEDLHCKYLNSLSVAYARSCTWLLLFGTLELAILCNLRYEKVTYLKRNPFNQLFERSFKTGQIFAMKGSRWVLAKEVLFHLKGCGHAQGHAMPNFMLDSKSSILGLSNEVSSVSKSFWKKIENWEKEKSIIWLNASKWRWLYIYSLAKH